VGLLPVVQTASYSGYAGDAASAPKITNKSAVRAVTQYAKVDFMMIPIKEGRVGPLNFRQLSYVMQTIKQYLRTAHVPEWALPLGPDPFEAMCELILQTTDHVAGRKERYRHAASEPTLFGISGLYREITFEQDRPNPEWKADNEEPVYRRRISE
jgi:hypothetical protein